MNTPLNPHLRQTNVIASAFSVGDNVTSQEWNHNRSLRNSGRSHYNLFYQLMDEVIRPLLPDFTFHWEARTDGRFYITNQKGDWLYLYWSKDIYDCYYIWNASF